MADNLSPSETSVLALPDHSVATLEGPDAVAFAQAQFANDVAALAVGHWQWNAWLTPKGRVIAVFALARRDEQALLAVLPDYPTTAFVEQLRRYVFRRKLKLDVPALAVGGAWSGPMRARGARLGLADDGALELDLGGAGAARAWRIGGASPAGDGVDAWRAADLRHGLARLPEAQREQWTPQQLSLDRLHAYSVKKGCYPGQEIVARTHFLGKAKRALALLEGDTALVPGQPVEAGGRECGQVVSAQAGTPSLALAVLPLEREPGPLSVAGAPVREAALREGLAR